MIAIQYPGVSLGNGSIRERLAIKPTRQLGLYCFTQTAGARTIIKWTLIAELKFVLMYILLFSFSETLPKQPQGFNVEAVNDTAVRFVKKWYQIGHFGRIMSNQTLWKSYIHMDSELNPDTNYPKYKTRHAQLVFLSKQTTLPHLLCVFCLFSYYLFWECQELESGLILLF